MSIDTKRVAALSPVVVVAMLATGAHAAVINPGTYRLGNHPDGEAAEPYYGLRLDEMYDVTTGHDVFTFDFEADGAAMYLDYDGTSVHIHGTAFGGLDTGSGYDWLHSGMVTIDFTYNLVAQSMFDDDLVVTTPDFTNSGSIQTWTNSEVLLYDYSGGHDYTFRMGDDDDDLGHRGYEGHSGWGWLNYQVGGDHVYSTDWLFTMTPVPAPGAAVLFALGLGRRRRRRR